MVVRVREGSLSPCCSRYIGMIVVVFLDVCMIMMNRVVVVVVVMLMM